MRPVPVVQMEEVVAQLSERGRLEWELAATKAQLAKALADSSEVVGSGHIPANEPIAEPVDNGGATPV